MKNKLIDFAPDLIQWIRDGKVEVESYLYNDGVYILYLKSESDAIAQYLDGLLELGIDVCIDDLSMECFYEELDYDYNGAYFEGGIVAERQVSLTGNDVPVSYVNQRIKDDDVELIYLR